MRIITALVVLFHLGGSPAAAKPAKPRTDAQKTFYAVGADAADRLLSEFDFGTKERNFVLKGFEDRLRERKSLVELKDYRGKIRQLSLDREEAARKKFLDRAAAAKGAKRFESGLIYRELKTGSGAKPNSTDRVTVHYHGTFPDGRVFDSSVNRGQPATFPLNGVISCWTQGVQLMAVGTKAELICPYPIAYGSNGRPPSIPPRSTLVFEVELLEIK